MSIKIEDDTSRVYHMILSDEIEKEAETDQDSRILSPHSVRTRQQEKNKHYGKINLLEIVNIEYLL